MAEGVVIPHKPEGNFVVETELSKSSSESTERPKRDEAVFQCVRSHPIVVTWCIYTIWVMIASAFTNAAGGSVLGIPQFRKDFGKPFEDGYVLPTAWQSAYYGATGPA